MIMILMMIEWYDYKLIDDLNVDLNDLYCWLFKKMCKYIGFKGYYGFFCAFALMINENEVYN